MKIYNSISASPTLTSETKEQKARMEAALTGSPAGGPVKGGLQSSSTFTSSALKKVIQTLIGRPLNPHSLLNYYSKTVVYSFNKVNNLNPLLRAPSTENLLKSLFLSMYSLISRPVYIIKHDKIIIRLFVFLSPKIDKYLDTSSLTKNGTIEVPLCKNREGGSSRISSVEFSRKQQKWPKASANIKRLFRTAVGVKSIALNKYLKFKSFRAKPVEILKSQIKLQLLKTASLSGAVLGLRRDGPQKAGLARASKSKILAYPNTSWVAHFKQTLEELSVIFGKIFNKKVEFEIIKAQLPFQDSYILAQILGYNADKYKFRRMLKILIPRAVIKNPSKELTQDSLKTEGIYNGYAFLNSGTRSPVAGIASYWGTNIIVPSSFHGGTPVEGPVFSDSASTPQLALPTGEGAVAGMNIKLAGRLMTQSIRPRFTVQSLQEGSLARVKVHFIEKSRFTGKNKRGAFSFTVTISHVFH